MADALPPAEPHRLTPPRVLLVDRDSAEAGRVARFLEGEGYEVSRARSGEEAFNILDERAVDGIITELGIPSIDAFRLMHVARHRDPEVCVILIADPLTADKATRAMLDGAHDYQTRPLNLEKLLAVLRRAEGVRELVRRLSEMSRRLDRKYGLQNIIGNSSAITAVVTKALQVAPTDANVLITGETGTGKELVGTAIHQNSARRNGPLIKLHCGDLAEGLVESELFGHEKGSFTGALSSRKGRFELADGGSLFLDEVAELSAGTQVKLLRVLEEGEFFPVGSDRSVQVDVRLIAATSRNLSRLVTEGRFREDLYYRLLVVTIDMPALRHRPQDIPLLADHFLKEAAEAQGKRIPGISSRVLQRFARHSWPGNVRELKNVITAMTVNAEAGRPLEVEDLPPELKALPDEGENLLIPIGTSWSEVERRLLEATMKSMDFDVWKAANVLGISPRTIYRRLAAYQGRSGGEEEGVAE